MAVVSVHKLDGQVLTETFDPQKGSGILAVLKEDYGSGKLLNAQHHRITPEQDVAAGQYTYQVTGQAAGGLLQQQDMTVQTVVDGRVEELLASGPRVDLRSLEVHNRFEIQGVMIQSSDKTTPPETFERPKQWSPVVQPSQTLWIKATRRKGNWLVNLLLGPPPAHASVRVW